MRMISFFKRNVIGGNSAITFNNTNCHPLIGYSQNTNGIVIRKLQVTNRDSQLSTIVNIYRVYNNDIYLPITENLNTNQYKVLLQGYIYLQPGWGIYVSTNNNSGPGVDFYVSGIELNENTTLL